MTRAELRARLTLNNSAFVRGMNSSMRLAEGFGRQMIKIGATVATMVALGKAAMFTGNQFKNAINQAANLQKLNVSFSVLTGSAKEAGRVMRDVIQFAKDTPLELPEVARGAKQLMAYGFSTKDLIRQLRMLGDVATALDVPLSDMVYVYGTLRAQGRAYARDVMQFTQRGVPLIEELAKVMGITNAEVKDAVENGKVGFAEVEKAFVNMTSSGGRFGNMLEKQSKTWSGQMAKLRDGIQMAMAAFGTPIINKLTPILEQGNAQMGEWTKKAQEFGEFAIRGVDVLKGFFDKPGLVVDTFTNYFTGSILSVGNTLITAFKTGLGFFKDGMVSAIRGIGSILLGTLLEAFRSPIAWFQASIQAVLESFSNGTVQAKLADAALKSAEGQLADIESRKPGSGATSWLGGKLGRKGDLELSEEEYRRQKENAQKLVELRRQTARRLRDEAERNKGQTRDEIYNELMAGDGPMIWTANGTMTGRQLIEYGTAEIKNGLRGYGASFSAARRSSRDYLGAGRYLSAGNSAVAAAATHGAGMTGNFDMFGNRTDGFYETPLDISNTRAGRYQMMLARTLKDRVQGAAFNDGNGSMLVTGMRRMVGIGGSGDTYGGAYKQSGTWRQNRGPNPSSIWRSERMAAAKLAEKSAKTVEEKLDKTNSHMESVSKNVERLVTGS